MLLKDFVNLLQETLRGVVDSGGVDVGGVHTFSGAATN